eukprot:1625610-Alexandrium_andersonii.AAC.1
MPGGACRGTEGPCSPRARASWAAAARGLAGSRVLQWPAHTPWAEVYSDLQDGGVLAPATSNPWTKGVSPRGRAGTEAPSV